jgi:hypothetical protein
MRIACAGLVAVAAVALAAAAGATSVRRLALDELVARADRIVLARCTRVEPAPPGPGGLPATAITFAVRETLKGRAGPTLVIRQLGRPGSGPGPAFHAGEERLLFLPRAGALGFTHPVGLAQGSLEVVRRAAAPAVVVGDTVLRALAAGEPGSAGVPLDTVLARVRALVGPPP